MARKSKWNDTDRSKLLKMVTKGVTEQEIREELGGMTSVEFAQ